MSKAFALKLYIFLLIVTTIAAMISMPTSLTLSFGKSSCSIFPSIVANFCTTLSFLPEKKEIVLHRPIQSLLLFGNTIQVGRDLSYGLDIQGGTQVTLATDMSKIAPEDKESAIASSQEVIAKRIDLFGVSESSVVVNKLSDQYRLLVSIPGVSDSQKAIELIGTTAQLEFREYKPTASSSATATISGYLVKDFTQTGLTGKNLKRSSVQFEQNTGKPIVLLEFDSDGTKQFASLTKQNISKPLGIFMDEYALSVPIVETEILDGQAQITGNFTLEQAKSLSVALNAGALPVPITVVSQKTVGPQLGQQAVQNSIRAGFIGVGLVMVFMVLIYGSKGIFSIISLLFYGILTLALYKLIPVTLTLPGIAGLLLSMGMAVDTNILVFERLTEEERKGHKSAVSLLSKSFERAFDSIKDANVTTLLICFILANPFGWAFLNTSGMVRGFAVTLAIGILINLVAGMIVTRVLMTLFYKPEWEE